jgi:MFS family permease
MTATTSRSRSQRLPRQFNLLWGATGLSNLGDGLRIVALPLLATSVTTDPRLIAGVTVAERLPWLIFILPGGAWADRVDRRILRMRLDIARAIVMSGLVAVIVADRVSIGMIYVVAALLASAEAVVDSSSMALVPAIVDGSDLERAGGRLTSTELLTNDLIGPVLGGLLFGLAMALPFGLDAASFGAAALMMSFMTGSYTAGVRRDVQRTTAVSAMRGDIAAGFRWLWSNQLLRRLAMISAALGTASFISSAVFVLFAQETLGLSAFGYGLLLVPGAIGGIAGSLLAPKLRRFPLRVILTLAVLGSGVAMLAISAATSAVVVGVLSGVSSASILVWNVLTIALRQRVIPNEWLGRVGASYRFMVYLGMPIGALLGGALAHTFSIRAAVFVSGATLVLLALVTMLSLNGAERFDVANGQGHQASTPA